MNLHSIPLKTSGNHGKMPVEGDQPIQAQRPPPETHPANPNNSEESKNPRKPFRIRASEGSSVFNLLFQ
jgi:hypothetical protein